MRLLVLLLLLPERLGRRLDAGRRNRFKECVANQGIDALAADRHARPSVGISVAWRADVGPRLAVGDVHGAAAVTADHATLQQRLAFPLRAPRSRCRRVRRQPVLDLKPDRPGDVTLVMILDQNMPVIRGDLADDAPDLVVVAQYPLRPLAPVDIGAPHGRIAENRMDALYS